MKIEANNFSVYDAVMLAEATLTGLKNMDVTADDYRSYDLDRVLNYPSRKLQAFVDKASDELTQIDKGRAYGPRLAEDETVKGIAEAFKAQWSSNGDLSERKAAAIKALDKLHSILQQAVWTIDALS